MSARTKRAAQANSSACAAAITINAARAAVGSDRRVAETLSGSGLMGCVTLILEAKIYAGFRQAESPNFEQRLFTLVKDCRRRSP